MSKKLSPHENVQIIVRSLEVDIVLGRLFPRERLIEEQLAARFKTTRHVVRQALLELEIAGLIVRKTNKGATVCEYSAEEVNQLYQMREIVEEQAALLIELPVDNQNLTILKKIYAKHAQAIDASDMIGVVAANKEFHQVLYRLCGNPFLADVIDEMAKKANLVRFTSANDLTLLHRAREEHLQIIEALEDTKNDTLAAICVKHLQPSRVMYLERHGFLAQNQNRQP